MCDAAAMRTRPAHLLLCGALLLGGLSACGDDDDDGDKPSDETEQDDANDPKDIELSNEDLEDFCNDVTDYIDDARALMTDPSDEGAAELQARGEELTERGEALQSQLSSADVAEMAECSQLIQAGAGDLTG
jgi:hypothetical protein